MNCPKCKSPLVGVKVNRGQGRSLPTFILRCSNEHWFQRMYKGLLISIRNQTVADSNVINSMSELRQAMEDVAGYHIRTDNYAESIVQRFRGEDFHGSQHHTFGLRIPGACHGCDAGRLRDAGYSISDDFSWDESAEDEEEEQEEEP